jgi:photosynthetic reaction center cytochrome c subunit
MNAKLAAGISFICIAGLASAGATRLTAQSGSAPAPQPPAHMQAGAAPMDSTPGQSAEQKFKNIKVLKSIPADQLIPSMQFIAASLGVECTFCHVEHEFDKDDKKPKLIARKMISMMMAINADNFKGEREVTCYSCHRGAVNPVGTPILGADATANARPTEAVVSATSAPPTAQAILDKYLAAAGGAAALEQVKTRVETGDIEVGDKKFPIEVYSEGPDKRVSNSHMGPNVSVTAYNGKQGWLTTPGGVRPMNATEAAAAAIDAQLYFPASVQKMFQDFKVGTGEVIDGKQTYLVLASGKDEPALRLYFDQDSGLLVRQIRYQDTPLGELPTQIDYADYRKAGDVTIPYRWTLARVNGRFTIQIDDVKQNVPVDAKLFVMPPPTPPRSGGGPPPNH